VEQRGTGARPEDEALRRLLSTEEVVYVVVHPDLEDAPANADVTTPLVDDGLVALLQPPPEPLRQLTPASAASAWQ
jgi:hypothetical protein